MAEAAGSSSHIHQSLRKKDGTPIFFDGNEKYGMSKTMQHYLAGLLTYADDTTFYVAGTDLTKIQSKLQASLDAACLWASGAGLKFSPEKSKVVIFTSSFFFFVI
mgnify:CR=1 FL=1